MLLTLGAIEIGLRLGAPAPIRPPARPSLPAGLPEILDTPQLTAPNVRGVIPPGVCYRTNSAGFRGREYARPKPPGVRIAVIGDSVVMGAGVDEEVSYPVWLEKILNAEGGSITYEVLNLGIAGLNAPAVIYRLYRARVVKVSPAISPSSPRHSNAVELRHGIDGRSS